MATSLPTSTPRNVRCHLCNAFLKPSAITKHVNHFCPARPKPGQQISPGTCPHCLASVSVTSMETHLLHSCPQLTVPCPFCQYSFQYIEQHLRKKHRDKQQTKQYQQLRNPPDPYSTEYSPAATHSLEYTDFVHNQPTDDHSCPICHTYMRDKKLRSHVKTHFKILCPCCKGRFHKPGLLTHLTNKCIPGRLPVSGGVVKCPVCKKQDSVSRIAQHLSVSHLTLSCPRCSATLGVKRVESHLDQCTGGNCSPGTAQAPLISGVFQKFRELEDDTDTSSDSTSSLSDDSSSDDELVYEYDSDVIARYTDNHSDTHYQSKPFFAPFLDPTDPDFILLPADKQRGKREGYKEDLIAPPYVSMGQKISCPVCDSDCPLRMMGRHITENHITHKCPVCNNQLPHDSFKQHLEECLGRRGPRQVKGQSTYPCPYCSKTQWHSVREVSTHIHRTHRQLQCPFCQDSYPPSKFCKHVNKCAKLCVMTAQLFQEHPSLNPETNQLYHQDIGSSNLEAQTPTRHVSNKKDTQPRFSSKLTCPFCNLQCRDVLLENHIAECGRIPTGMELVSMNNLLGLRIN